MGMFERVIRALIYIAFMALAFYVVVAVLGMLGIVLPVMVVRILGVILMLFALLVIIRLFAGSWPDSWRWFP